MPVSLTTGDHCQPGIPWNSPAVVDKLKVGWSCVERHGGDDICFLERGMVRRGRERGLGWGGGGEITVNTGGQVKEPRRQGKVWISISVKSEYTSVKLPRGSISSKCLNISV